MKKIKPISLPKLSNGTHYAFHYEMLERLNGDAKVKSKVADELKAYEKAFKEEERLLALSRKSFLTDEIKEADSVRDNAYTLFRNAVKTFVKIPEEKMRSAGQRLWQALKDYNIDVRAPFYKQTGLMTKLLKELESKYKAEVEELNLGSLVEIMRGSNDTLRKAIYKRNDEKSEKLPGAAKAARKEVDDAYKAVVERINALVVVERTTEYNPCIDGMNGLIDYQRKQPADAKEKTPDTDPANGTGGTGGEEIPDPVAPTPTPGDGGTTGGPTGGATGGGEDELPDPLA